MKILRSFVLALLLSSTLAAQQTTPAPAQDTAMPANTPPLDTGAPATSGNTTTSASGNTTASGTTTAVAPATGNTTASGNTTATPENPLGPGATPPPAQPQLNIAFPGGNSTAAATTTSGNTTTSSNTTVTTTTTTTVSGGPLLNPDEPMEVADFPNEEVREILRKIADLYELNVVIPDTLVGTTSVKLHNVKWQQIFKVVLDPLGFTYVVDNSGPSPIIMVKNKADVAAEPLETRVLLVNSAKADELAKSMATFLDTKSNPPETIIPDTRTNSLIITARPNKMNNLQEAIERLDRPTQQVSIEAKFYELNADNTKDLGIQWGFNGTQLASIGWAAQQNIANGLNAIPQSGSLPLAQTPAGAGPSSVTAPANQNLNLAQSTSSLATLAYTPPRRAADLAIFNQAQYNAILIAMQTIDTARLVASPTAVTLDNQEITIFIGTNITIVFPTVNNQTGQTTPGSNTNYLVGTTMKVKPHVTNDGFINLTLNPELSRVELQTDNYFGGNYPRIDSRKLTDANVSLKDGYTIAIGGLIDDTDATSIKQVPILGDIPVLGELFKSRSTVHTRKNLIIFVTAKTLSREGATYRDIISPEMLIRSEVTAQDVPGYWDSYHTGLSPGMAYASPEEKKSMADVQAARDAQAAQKQQAEFSKDLKDAGGGPKKTTTPSPTPAPSAFKK